MKKNMHLNLNSSTGALITVRHFLARLRSGWCGWDTLSRISDARGWCGWYQPRVSWRTFWTPAKLSLCIRVTALQSLKGMQNVRSPTMFWPEAPAWGLREGPAHF